MTTPEAFTELLKSPPKGLTKALGKNSRYLVNLRKKEHISIDLMEKILIASGWSKVKNESWKLKK